MAQCEAEMDADGLLCFVSIVHGTMLPCGVGVARLGQCGRVIVAYHDRTTATLERVCSALHAYLTSHYCAYFGIVWL